VIFVAKVSSRVLVIDASIARAAGDVSMHPTSRSCREFLQDVLNLCHSMAMTAPIQEEWNTHQSRFARQWRKSMMARKKVETVEVPSHLSLEKRFKLAVADKHVVAIIEKDRHLIEAALATDQRVASLDDEVRKHLQDRRPKLPEVATICWVNPSNRDERVVDWLESGAPADRFRTLGHVPPRPKE
jgi:hypothetical protein